jgi:glycosyltransferase involved in cell wall biosynthesis
MDEKSVTVIPIGPDDEFFDSEPPRDLEDRDPYLLSIGDIYPHKRLELAIEGLAILKEAHPNLELRIAGREMDSDYKSRLLRTIEDLAVEDRVEFVGSLSPVEVKQLYRSTMIFVTTSALESFGLTPIEAMASGLPVIASRSSAIPEICGDAAIYFDEQEGSLAERVDSLLSDAELWRRRQDSGLAHCRKYAWSCIGEQYAELIERTMQEPRQR